MTTDVEIVHVAIVNMHVGNRHDRAFDSCPYRTCASWRRITAVADDTIPCIDPAKCGAECRGSCFNRVTNDPEDVI